MSILKSRPKILYTKEFKAKIISIRSIYKRGNLDKALSMLKSIDDKKLLTTEVALWSNLIGVIYFNKKQYNKSIEYFNIAYPKAIYDDTLMSQAQLNLAGSYYMVKEMQKALETLNSIDYNSVSELEKDKFKLLHYNVSKEAGDRYQLTIALIRLLGNLTTIEEVKNSQYYKEFYDNFSQYSINNKFKIFKKLEDENNFALGFISYKDMVDQYYKGNSSDFHSLLSWLRRFYGSVGEISSLVEDFALRIDNNVKINKLSIGVILPLSGSNKNYGKRALMGIDNALKSLDKDGRYKLLIYDSQGSSIVGSRLVNNLVSKESVSVIIGGLFSDEAMAEYIEAKKYGVFFISLSPIYIAREQKNHLLLEVPGSIESQIEQLFSEKMLDIFGRTAKIIYPNNSRGKTYVNEFWRKALLSNVEIKGAVSYDVSNQDYRQSVKDVLNLKFPREREEELDILTQIYTLEHKRDPRRIQLLKPIIDFDWIFIPSLPKESIQIIPSFQYYDAYNISIIGNSSWRSRIVLRESKKYKSLFFVGDNISILDEKFKNSFLNNYGYVPRLIELISFDAFSISYRLLEGMEATSRDGLDIHLRSLNDLSGITGSWNIKDGLWIKDLSSFGLKSGQIKDAFSIIEKSKILKN